MGLNLWLTDMESDPLPTEQYRPFSEMYSIVYSQY